MAAGDSFPPASRRGGGPTAPSPPGWGAGGGRGARRRAGPRAAVGDGGALAGGVLVGDADRVGGGAVADDLGEDRRAALLRVLERLQDDHARAFAEHEPAALVVERARRL